MPVDRRAVPGAVALPERLRAADVVGDRDDDPHGSRDDRVDLVEEPGRFRDQGVDEERAGPVADGVARDLGAECGAGMPFRVRGGPPPDPVGYRLHAPTLPSVPPRT
jgi:hypothetical protein